jgi:RNA polymerase sigma factor (sigma-70 family)
MIAESVVASEDAAIVARCAEGDGAAWEALVARYSALVWAVVRRMGLGAEDAADAFQSTWTVALEEIPRLRRPEAFPAWISRIARHQCLRVRRGYGIARTAHRVLAREDADTTLPDADLERREVRARVRAALGGIGERCSRLLALLYEADPSPSYEEIARTLDMRIGSIGPTRARGLEKLLRELGDDDA